MKMPDLATTDSTIKVIRWLVTPGQPIKRGQALLEVETDKATMEVECIATGVFKQPLAQPGDTLLAGQALAAIEVEGPTRPAAAAPPASPSDLSAKASATAEVPPSGTKEGTTIENRNSKIENSPTPAPAPKPAGGMFAKNRDAANRRAP